MKVVATAGHVDHGKSTLVRALTGTDPDRWDEEHRRGLTIDLGFAWTTLPDGEEVALVDVPGHQRFIANTLAGLGPSPAVLLVVSAEEGWRAQTQEHVDALRALDVRHLLVAVTRSDLADAAPVVMAARDKLSDNGFGDVDVEVLPVSAVTGAGMDDLRSALGRLVAGLPAPDVDGRVRLWVDRVFTIRGAGTVVTGTLASGTVREGDRVEVAGRTATVRSVQALDRPRDAVGAVARVALNLRGVAKDEVARGDVVTTGAWHLTHAVDVRVENADGDLPGELMAHVGTTALRVRVRPLGREHARLTWAGDLPITAGDRLVLRDPGRQQVLAGALVLDADPPPLRRRGDARRWAERLTGYDGAVSAEREVGRRGWMTTEALVALGGTPGDVDLQQVSRWVVSPDQWREWAAQLTEAVDDHAQQYAMKPHLPAGAASEAVGLPDLALLSPLATEAGLQVTSGEVSRPGARADLGAAEAAVAQIEQRLATAPFAAPERDELAELGLTQRELAAAVRLGRLLDLGDLVVLAPRAPAQAMRDLSRLDQPFTTSEARQALGTTRRVVIPLLEHLDGRGWTRRLDATHREVT